jgi:hypothetical protein
MNNYDIIITGTGPAGLFCAINCAVKPDTKILVIEKNSSPGKKFLLSGTGQCNITHTGTVPEFTRHYGSGGNFVKPALSAFTPAAMISFLNEHDIPTIEKENGKIFPESMRAIDVLSMLMELCENGGVEFRFESAVTDAVYENGKFTVSAGNEKFTSQVLVIAAGGESYPDTGSTGDGFRLAENLGHKIISTTASLTPVYIRSFPFAELSGISFKNRNVSLFKDGRKTCSITGDILFTHKGLSGPAILDLSRYISRGDILEVSLTGRNTGDMNNDFISESRVQGKKSIKTFLKNYDIPERLIIGILAQEGIDPLKNVSEISRTERVKLFKSLGEYPFIVEEKGNFNVAMATSGGVCRDEIDKRTMESKIIPGLYFAGEVIDVDGDTGGYNIQWAFSSGKTAADGIKRKF